MKVKASLDSAGFSGKPGQSETAKITTRIAQNNEELELKELADLVGIKGHTFCPAVFSGGKRRKENFLQMQLFGLDFDAGICFDEIMQIADEYDLPVAFAYHTFSSTETNPKFRIVFVSDIPITDACAAEIMLAMLLQVFPAADKSCKDVSRMFFGGKGC